MKTFLLGLHKQEERETLVKMGLGAGGQASSATKHVDGGLNNPAIVPIFATWYVVDICFWGCIYFAITFTTEAFKNKVPIA